MAEMNIQHRTLDVELSIKNGGRINYGTGTAEKANSMNKGRNGCHHWAAHKIDLLVFTSR